MPSCLDCGTDTMYNSLNGQWACSLTWGPRQWNFGYNFFRVASTHPFKAYTPDKVIARIFCSQYISWLFPRLWPERSWLLNNFTPWWAAILVTDAIRRDFELNVSFLFLGASLDRCCLLALVSIVENLFSLWEWRYWNTKLAVWDLGWRRHRPS